MPQVQRNTTGMKTINEASLTSLIATMKSTIVVGAGVTASDVNQVIAAYNTWRQHTHTADDLKGIDTFGNLAFYGAATWKLPDPSSSAAKNLGGTLFPNNAFLNAVNDEVDDTDVNSFIASINSIREHIHTIFDTLS